MSEKLCSVLYFLTFLHSLFFSLKVQVKGKGKGDRRKKLIGVAPGDFPGK